MARKKKRGPGRPKGSKNKAKRGRPAKAAAKRKRGPGRPKGKTKVQAAKRGRPAKIAAPTANNIVLQIDATFLSGINRMAAALERAFPVQAGVAIPGNPQAPRVGAQAAPIPADQVPGALQ